MNALELNALGFEGDTFLKEEIERLVKEHGIDAIVETGTYLGNTTLQFSEMAQMVYTIEMNNVYYALAADKCYGKNIHSYYGSSDNVLASVISYLPSTDHVLFYLDAHWNANNPLLRELEIIAENGLKPVIVIHDFKVPEHPELGFDSYDGQDYEWSWIEDRINAIYDQEGYDYHYNSEATGAKRGVIFIEPKK